MSDHMLFADAELIQSEIETLYFGDFLRGIFDAYRDTKKRF